MHAHAVVKTLQSRKLFYIHQTNPSRTPANPNDMPVISFPPAAAPFVPLALAEAAVATVMVLVAMPMLDPVLEAAVAEAVLPEDTGD